MMRKQFLGCIAALAALALGVAHAQGPTTLPVVDQNKLTHQLAGQSDSTGAFHYRHVEEGLNSSGAPDAVVTDGMGHQLVSVFNAHTDYSTAAAQATANVLLGNLISVVGSESTHADIQALANQIGTPLQSGAQLGISNFPAVQAVSMASAPPLAVTAANASNQATGNTYLLQLQQEAGNLTDPKSTATDGTAVSQTALLKEQSDRLQAIAASLATTLQVNVVGGALAKVDSNGYQVVTVSNPTISGGASTTYDLLVVLNRSPQTTRWNSAINSVQFAGLQADDGQTFTTLPTAPWVMFVGDSITEGVGAQGNPSYVDNIYDYSWTVGQSLRADGYDYAVSANGGSGFLKAGDSPGDVPPYYLVTGGTYQGDAASRWSRIDQGVSLLDTNGHISGWGGTGQEPALIFVNYNSNEAFGSASLSDLKLAIQGWISAARAAAPNAWIVLQVPFSLRTFNATSYQYCDVIQTAVTAYLTANPGDAKVIVSDYGANFSNLIGQSGSGAYIDSDLIHPNQLGHSVIGPRVLDTILTQMRAGSTPTATAPRFRSGFRFLVEPDNDNTEFQHAMGW